MRRDANARIVSRPVLLIIDDFEQALEEHAGAPHTLRPEFVVPIRAVVRAFRQAATDSRLLFTSRFQFSLPDGAADLADQLLDVPLRGMDPNESRKQAAAKLRLESTSPGKHARNLPLLFSALEEITSAGKGNPGLQDLLIAIFLDDPVAGRHCLDDMEAFEKKGAAPNAEAIRIFLEDLAVDRLLTLLTSRQKDLLRAATLFNIPVPASVLNLLAEQEGDSRGEDIARLVALGVCEIYESLQAAERQSLAINSIVRPFVGALSETERAKFARVVIPALFAQWGGEAGRELRSYAQDYELARLAMIAPEAEILAATAADALRSLGQKFEYREAAARASRIMALLDDSGVEVSVGLLRTAAEACEQVGDVGASDRFLERALSEISRLEKQNAPVSPRDQGAVILALARSLVARGEPDSAIIHFEKAQVLLQSPQERAVVLGDIARLRAAKGEVDAALAFHQEALAVYESLGAKRERAITLGDIARLRAARGEVDAALALHQERLAVYESLGAKRERATTLGDIARLRAAKGEVDAALALHQERLAVYESLGAKRERATTLGDIARLRAAKGEVDAALALHQEALAVYDSLGAKRERAITLGDIARLRAAKGEVDAALALHQEALAVYDSLGAKRERAITLGDIARLRAARGEVDAALALHQEELAVYDSLGAKRERAITLGDIARLRAARGEVDAAFALHQEALAVYESLGDKDRRANALWSIANLELGRQEYQQAWEHLSESYEINLELGRLDAICFVGLDLGSLLCAAGLHDQGRAILKRSRDGFLQLGRPDFVRRAESLLAQCTGDAA